MEKQVLKKKGVSGGEEFGKLSGCDSERMCIHRVPCGLERPPRDTLCQRPKGHSGRHYAVIFWEDEATETRIEPCSDCGETSEVVDGICANCLNGGVW